MYKNKVVYLINVDARKGMKIKMVDSGGWMKHLLRPRTRMFWPELGGYTEVNKYSLWDVSDDIRIVFTMEDIPRPFSIETNHFHVIDLEL